MASSQIVQQRVEAIRNRPLPEVTNAKSVAALLRVPTDSEKELAIFANGPIQLGPTGSWSVDSAAR